MKASIKACYNEKRNILAEKLPLKTPYSIIITPTSACNFKCTYCPQSTKSGINVKKNLSWTTFVNICGQISEFEDKIKAIHFHGWGEPLLNQDLPKMISYMHDLNITENIHIITNGSLLNEKLSLSLIESGVDFFKISIQGLTSDDYEKICSKKIDIEKLVQNIKYLYENKGNCSIFIKISDIAIRNADEESFFYNLFGKYCDRISVECIRPIFKSEKDLDITSKTGKSISMYNWTHKPIHVCSLPFYMMQISSSGDIIPCCSHLDPAKFGNIADCSLKDVWNSLERNDFLKMMLSKERKKQNIYKVCSSCEIPDMTIRYEDELDSHVNELRKMF